MSDPDESSSDLSSTEDESSELESSFDNTEGLEGVVRLPPAASSFIVSSAEESPTKATHSETSKKVKRRKKTISSSPKSQTSSESSSESEKEDSIENAETEETESTGIPSSLSPFANIFQRNSVTQQKKSRNKSRSPLTKVSSNNEVPRDADNNVQESSQTFAWVGPKRACKASVWKHWGFKSFINIPFDYSKVFCKHCDKCINYKKSSTNMKMHMNSKHQNLVFEDGVTQPKALQYFEPQQVRKEKYPKKHPINKRARAALVK